MPLIIFSFSLKTETQEAVFAGNIGIQQALQVLQQLTIADAIQKAKEQAEIDEKPKEQVKDVGII